MKCQSYKGVKYCDYSHKECIFNYNKICIREIVRNIPNDKSLSDLMAVIENKIAIIENEIKE